VFHLARLTPVLDTAGQRIDEPDLSVRLSKQQQAGIGSQVPAVEASHQSAAANRRKLKA
jgi:hypothetical protein